MLQDIPLPNLHHLAARGDALPRRVEELAREGVEDKVDAAAGGGAHDVGVEGRAVGVEDARAGDAVVGYEVVGLF